MRISISEARRRLPALVKQIQRDPATRVEITVRDEPVAELRPIERHPKPGEAARKLLALARRTARTGAQPASAHVSEKVKDHLYGPDGITR